MRHHWQAQNGLTFYYVGPHFNEGKLPAVFYFALSVEETLYTDPYNQPVEALSSHPVRIFSLDLPEHGLELSSVTAIERWVHRMEKGEDLLGDFFEQVKESILELMDMHVLDKVAFMGLSRGAFVACQIAAKMPTVHVILGFAPLTEMSGSHPSLSLHPHIQALANRTIRFYIGNHDTRVGTDKAFHFIEKVADAAYHKRIRSSPIELIIGPSIGHQGHGTSKEVFIDGANWIWKQIGVKHA